MYHSGLYSFLFDFYRDLKIIYVKKIKGKSKDFQRYININRLSGRLKIFAASLDNMFGYLTEEQLRSVFVSQVKNPTYIIPSTHIGLLIEFDRVMGDGLVVRVGKIVEDMKDTFVKIERLNPFNVDTGLLYHYPIFVALTNSFTRLDALLGR
jgi:hypothetical protein